MELPELPNALRQEFPHEVIETLVDCLNKGYETAIELHDESRGGNETTFGLGLYHYNIFEFTRAANNGAPFSVRRTSVFRLKIGDLTIACHRVGRTASDNIWQSFPGNVDATTRLIQEQFEFSGEGFDRDLSKVKRFILAHMGNSNSGLEALYLTVPKKVGNDIEWVFAYLVWKRDNTAYKIVERQTPDSTLAPVAPAPVEEIPDKVAVRKKKQQDLDV